MQVHRETVERIHDFIYSRSLLRFSAARLSKLEAQLKNRLEACECPSLEDYYRILREDREEFDNLIEGIVTRETYFFRLPGQFEALKDHVLPVIEEYLSQELIQRMRESEESRRSIRMPLRIWSAGCSTGEEPLSIAMAVKDGLQYPRAWELEILATDISWDALKVARRGLYENGLGRRIPTADLERHLSRSEGGWRVSEDHLKAISYWVFNLCDLINKGRETQLLEGMNGLRRVVDLFQRFDVIFCRNVMIYFDYKAQQKLVRGLYNCLKPGGYLFTGDTELLHVYEHDFETVDVEGTIFYRKPGRPNYQTGG